MWEVEKNIRVLPDNFPLPESGNVIAVIPGQFCLDYWGVPSPLRVTWWAFVEAIANVKSKTFPPDASLVLVHWLLARKYQEGIAELAGIFVLDCRVELELAEVSICQVVRRLALDRDWEESPDASASRIWEYLMGRVHATRAVVPEVEFHHARAVPKQLKEQSVPVAPPAPPVKLGPVRYCQWDQCLRPEVPLESTHGRAKFHPDCAYFRKRRLTKVMKAPFTAKAAGGMSFS